MQSKFSMVLWKFLKQVPGQSTSNETRKDFRIMESLHISGKFCEVQQKNMHPLDPFWRSSFKNERPYILDGM